MVPKAKIRTALFLAFIFVGSRGLCGAQSQKPLPSRLLIDPAFGNRNVTFEANEGQTSSQVRFISRGNGYTAFLTANGMVLSLHAVQRQADHSSAKGLATSSKSLTMGLRLLGAARDPMVRGVNQQPGTVNYFIGNDRTKWHRNVPTYAEVRYQNVYPGIDLLYHSHQGRMEYDFALTHGADPTKICFEINGARQVSVDTDGNLILDTVLGQLRFEAPVVYQETDGQRVLVKGGYVLEDATHVRFALESYDRSASLIIDPVLVYSTYFGGGGTEAPGAIAVDSSGDVYLVGSTDSPDFPINEFGSPVAGIPHVFVAKFSTNGSNLIFCDYLGGNGVDQGYGLALDAANNIYLTGSTSSSNFPLMSPYQGTYPGSDNGFLSKISANGSNLLYSTYFGGNGSDIPVGVAVDAGGNMIIAGYTSSTNLPVANAFQANVSPNQGGFYGYYGFLTKFTSIGSSLVYSTYFGGSSMVPFDCNGTPCWGDPNNTIQGIALDPGGNAFVAGTTNTYDFPVTVGAYQTTDQTPSNGSIGFVGKFDQLGNIQYSTYFGGDILTDVTAVAGDASGSAYITGLALNNDGTFPLTSTSICDPNVYGAGCSFAFISKFNPSGATLVYSTFLGPNNDATPTAIALDTNNDAYVAAATASSSFATVNGIEPFSNGADVLLVEIDAAASTQLFATFLGGAANDQPASAGLAVDTAGNIYVAGSTASSDFPATTGAFQTAFGGNTDAFVAKIGPQVSPAASFTPLSLLFAGQSVGSTSSSQTVLLRNMGSAPLSISSTVASGDFSETDNCGNSVPAASSCTLSISFKPVAPGTRVGSVTVQDDAAGSPHSIGLSGIGLGPIVNLTPASLTFSDQLVGTSSASQAITLSNTGNAALNISSIESSGDFSQSNNCPSILAATAACTINVTFTPTATGTRTGGVTVSDSAGGSPQSAALTGMGVNGNPIVTLAPTALTFTSQLVGTTSATQIISVSNTGNAALNISSIQIAGDFAETNSCPASLASSSGCTINVTFTPTSAGTRTGFVTISDSASGSPQSVALTGTGTNPSPIVLLSPASLTFASELLGTYSPSQAITVSNIGNAALDISGIQITGDFSQTNNCPASLAAAGVCTIQVTFTPVSGGVRSGTVMLSDSASGSPQSVSLTGTGASPKPNVSVTPGSLTFPSEPIGTVSTRQTLTVSNPGNAALDISGIQISGDFSQTNTCPASLPAGTTCLVNVTFAPTAAGVRAGAVAINSNAANSPETVEINGTGADFSITSSVASDTISAGSSAAYSIKVSPVGGSFASSVKLSCSGAPENSTCSLSSSAVTPGSKSATVTVTITTAGQSTQASAKTIAPLAASWIGMPGFGFFGILLLGSRRRLKEPTTRIVVMILLSAALLFMAGCAGGTGIASQGGSGTVPGNYTVTVSGDSGKLQHSLPLTLTVQ